MRRWAWARAVLVAACCVSVGRATHAADADIAGGGPPLERTARFTIGALAGTGYGWADGVADVNRDTPVSGGHWARLGQVVVEGGVLFPRARFFLLTGPRFQAITGTTDVYANNFVARTRSSAFAWFSKVGWMPRAPEARLQPYVALSAGWGDIAHVVSLQYANCGPERNQTCVDTITSGPLFLGWGAGVRARLTSHLDAVLAVENQVGLQADLLVDLFEGRGLEEHTLNFDLNVGLAAAF